MSEQNDENIENNKQIEVDGNSNNKVSLSSNLQNLKHREFLQNQVKFKEVVKIQDEAVLESIHITYRLTYLKDTAMARFIDDQVLANVNSLIFIKS